MRTPTLNQFARLRDLARGGIVVSPKRGDWAPLLRQGWVERADETITPRGGCLPPLRITPEGFYALGRALERHGWPPSIWDRPS